VPAEPGKSLGKLGVLEKKRRKGKKSIKKKGKRRRWNPNWEG